MRTVELKRSHSFEIVEVRTLRIYDDNARLHSAAQVAQIAKSIEHFGVTNPLLVDENNELIAGHGRLEALKSLGVTSTPIMRISGLTENEKRALVLADNKLALNASWDDKKLAEQLRALEFSIQDGTLDFKLDELVGFSELEVKDLMSILDEPAAPEPVRDITVEDEPAVARPGETWQLGPHRLTIGGKELPRDADVIIRQWERETKEEAKLAGSGETFKSRAAVMGIEFVKPTIKTQKARNKAAG